MSTKQHKKDSISSDCLVFDANNPRLVGEDVSSNDDIQIIRYLSQSADIAELVISIIENTFVDFEPIVVIKEKNEKYRVLEGNRRLAAIRLIQNKDLSLQVEQDLKHHIKRPVSQDVLDSIADIPVIIVEEEKDAQAYIGFKHINGPHKWTSFAKAKFVMGWHKNGIPINDIANKVGDKNQTVKNLIAGMLVLEQAESEDVFEIADRTKRGVFGFSHLYTALNRKEYRDYLGLTKEWMSNLTENPIDKSKVDKLEKVLKYMYGSKKDNIDSVMRSQNPNLKQLGIVFSNPVATQVLIETNNLERALEETEEKSAVFERSLIAAHTQLQKAFVNVSTFDGEQPLLDIAEKMKKSIKLLVSNMNVIIDDQ